MVGCSDGALRIVGQREDDQPEHEAAFPYRAADANATQPFVLSPLLSATGVARARTNATPFQQSNVATDPIARDGRIWQYAAWYDREPEPSRLTLAGRSRPEADLSAWSEWSVAPAAPGLNGNDAGDPHYAASLGIDPSGRVHVAWRAHAAEGACLYWRGDGPGDIDIDSNGPMFVAGISYPKFVNRLDRSLLFSGRLGSAGNDGQQTLWCHDDASDTWRSLSDVLIDWPGETKDEQSPYMHRIRVNPVTGCIHLAWVWARRNVTKAYHDIYYMRSFDGGQSFEDISGQPISLPASNARNLLAWPIPENSGLPVHHGLDCTADDTPIIACYYAPHSPATELFVITYQDGSWVRRRVGLGHQTWNLIGADGGEKPWAPNSEYLQISQPGVIVGNGSVHVYYRSNFEHGSESRPVVRVRSCYEPTLTRWSPGITLVDMPIGDSQPTHDTAAWDAFGVPTFYIQLVDDHAQYGNPAATSVYVAEATLPT